MEAIKEHGYGVDGQEDGQAADELWQYSDNSASAYSIQRFTALE